MDPSGSAAAEQVHVRGPEDPLRAELVMGPAVKPEVLDRARPAEGRRHDVVELELPGAPAAVPVLRDPGAPAAVPRPHLATDRRRDGLPRLARLRSAVALLLHGRRLPHARRLDRALPLAVRLEGAAHRLAQHGREVAAGDLVGEEVLQGLELLLE